MKKHLLRNVLLLAVVFFTSSLFAQDWVKMMQDPNVNFNETQKAFNRYVENYKTEYRNKNSREPERVPGYKQFKRWEWFMAPRVSKTGERFAPDAVWQAMKKYNEQHQSAGGGAGSWTSMGPVNTTALAGAGRLNFIRIHPTNPNTLYVGSPSGGLWISTNGGSSWTSNTDNLNQVIGCTDVAFDLTEANTMYMATGDGDAGDNYSVGLLKSTDGAATWNTTGLSFNTAQYKQISKVLVNPTNGNIMVASTGGIWQSTDKAGTFTQVQTGSFKDMEFKPGTPSTIYACGVVFRKSTDGGTSWTKITSGLPDSSNLTRMAIAVSAANANTVYLVAINATTNDMEGVYKSTNSGTSFTKVSSPNIGNQGWYDLCIAASPTNSQEVMLGGQTIFLKSTNGGTSWSQIATSTHVDYHDVIYTSGTSAYLTSDGGVWRTTNNGSSWTDLSNGLPIMQFYGFGHSATTANLLIAGAQDNGTSIYDGSWYEAPVGGDGMLAFISHSNDNFMWGSRQNGSLTRSTNGGNSFSQCDNIPETCPWVTQWSEDPLTGNTIYAGCENVWISYNGGVNWTNPGEIVAGNTSTITALAVSPANPLVIWTGKGGILYSSQDGGTTWTPITTVPSGTITDIACHQTDASKAWITFSGFTNTNKVFQTEDMGISWTNLSGSVPNIPVNCIAVNKDGNDALYIGTDAGVFFKDASTSVWQPFSNGLPNVIVNQLEIFYPGSKIRAATYGRGVWESDFYQPGAYPPVANLSGNNLIGCPGLGVQYSDYSSGEPTSRSWSFPGGEPASSTEQYPYVSYNTAGTYSVSLTVTNANGIDSQTIVNYISVNPSSGTPPSTSGKIFCGPATVTLTATPAGTGTLRWWDKPGGGNMVATGNTYSPNLFGSANFYVDEAFPNTDSATVGPLNNSIGTGTMFPFNDIRGLYFDVLEPVVINSFDVYANVDGDRTIEILDEQGNSFYETTVFIPESSSTPVTVPVDIPIYAGNNYFIKFRGLVDVFRNNTGASYPYTSTSINITESNASIPGYYYFFYNWQYSKAQCNTGRTLCSAADSCNGFINGLDDLFADNSITVYPNPNEGIFSLAFYAVNQDNYTITVINALGQKVYEQQLKSFTGTYSNKIDIALFNSGVYMLQVSNSKNKTVRKIIVY